MPETETKVITVTGKKIPTETQKYGRIADDKGMEYLVFKTSLLDHLEIATEAEIQWHKATKKDKSGTYNSLDNVKVAGEWVVKPQGPLSPGRSYGKSQEELIQQRQLAEAQNRSIQAQTALNRAVELAIARLMPIPQDTAKIDLSIVQSLIADTTKEFYQLLQSLTEISQGEVIVHEIKKHPSVQKDKTTAPDGKENTDTGQLPRSETREARDPTTPQELMAWCFQHGKQPSEVKEALGLAPMARIENIALAVQKLREDFNWKD